MNGLYWRTDMDGREIIQAATGQTMGSLTMNARAELVKANIVRAFGLRGLPVPDDMELQSMTREVTAKIERSYRHLTAAELAMVMEAGVSGELGKDVRVTCAAVFGWLATYMSSELRRDALKTGMKSFSRSNLLPAEHVAELNRNAEINGARALWEEYKANGNLASDHLDGYLEMVCDGLIRRGCIRPNDAAWQLARKKARAEERRQVGDRSLSDCLHARKEKKFILLLYFSQLYERLEDLPELM